MKRLAISVNEFRKMLLSSCPPTGWGNKIAVAHSGGADSTCLLYLLRRLVSELPSGARDLPREVLAISVDHSLQPGSADTAERCRRFAESLKIPHLTLRIPWGAFPFPDLPGANRPYESVARAARYRLLMEAMKTRGATVIAMGHHADDHVETLLMRLARVGSGDATPTGIRKCRRWGMGTKQYGLDWAGAAGMHRWIVRPLLGVPKERILVTCELNSLNYSQDPSNFQPSLTPRNYVRYCLSNKLHLHKDPQVSVHSLITPKDSVAHSKDEPPLVQNLDSAIQRLDKFATKVPDLCRDAPRMDRLYAAANFLGELRDINDTKATQYLHEFMRPSPPSTLLLSRPPHGLVPPPEIRREVILRVLRFVSPRPWGSPSSEASRQTSSLNVIDDMLWSSPSDVTNQFSAGSEVLWRPVSLRDGHIRLTAEKSNPHQLIGWLASRQPPMKRSGNPSPCVQDISKIITSNTTQELLWDNRFLVKLRPHLLPSDILESCQSPGSVMVLPHSRWFLPKIVCRRSGHDDLHLGGVGLQDKEISFTHILSSGWAEIQWTRSLEAT